MSTTIIDHSDFCHMLISYFLTQCEHCFEFLQEEYGFQLYTGLTEFRKGRKIIKPVKQRDPSELALAICRMEKDEIAIEITLSENDFVMDGYVYFDFINRFSFHDIVSAGRKRKLKIESRMIANSETLIDFHLMNIAACIKKEPELFTIYNEKLVKRALKIRSKRIEHSLREQNHHNMQKTIERAAKAYRDKDYRKVVELYKPYEAYLKGSDRKKYKQAITYLTTLKSLS